MMDSFLKGLSKLRSLCLCERIEITILHEKRVIYVCRTLSENSFGFSSKNIMRCAKQPSSCPENLFDGKFSFFGNTFFVVFGIRATFFFRFVAEYFQQACKNCTPRDQINTLRDSFSTESSFFSMDLA